jgi:hypothetical protein
MTRNHGTTLRVLLATLTVLVLAEDARAASSIVLPRAGQVGFGAQGAFGALTKGGTLGQEFGSGPGLAVRMRYRMRYERAIGLSFEAQSLDAREQRLASDLPFDLAADVRIQQMNLLLSGVEMYQMFGTRTRTTKMISAGIGIAQPTIKLSDGETVFPGDGLYLSAGAGVEHFFYRSWAFDLSTRYQAVFQDQRVNHDIQAQLGLICYASF